MFSHNKMTSRPREVRTMMVNSSNIPGIFGNTTLCYDPKLSFVTDGSVTDVYMAQENL